MKEPELIAVTLITDEGLKAVAMQPALVGELVEKFRTEGSTPVHTTEASYNAEGIIITAKGSKNQLLLIPETYGFN